MAKQLAQFMRAEMERKFEGVDGGVIVTYSGLDSEQIYDFRKKLRGSGAKFAVVKNTTALRALATLGYDSGKLEKLFEGPVGIVYSPSDGVGGKPSAGVVGAVKALDLWLKESKNKSVTVKGGLLEKSVLNAKDVKALADMPSRQQLLGMVAGAFQAPMSALAGTFKGCAQKFAGTLEALKDKKEKAGG